MACCWSQTSTQENLQIKPSQMETLALNGGWHARDEHRTGLGLDWNRTIATFVEFGLDSDCKSFQNLGTGPDLD